MSLQHFEAHPSSKTADKLPVPGMVACSSPVLRWQWVMLWAFMALALVTQIAYTWYLCLSHKSLSDIVIPIMTALILVGAVRNYAKTAPVFSAHCDISGLSFLLMMSFLTAAGNYFHFSRIHLLGFLGMVAGFVWAIAGGRYCRHWLPVYLFSLELIPGAPVAMLEWGSVWLRVISTRIAACLASFFIPITASDTVFQVKGNSFEVSAACCGLSMWTGVIFVLLLWQLFTPVRIRKLALLLVAGTALAVLMNGVRLCLTALVAYWSSVDAAIAIHSNLEYLLFPVTLLLLWIFRRTVNA